MCVRSERTASTATLRKSMDFFMILGRRARDEIDRVIRNPGRSDIGNGTDVATPTSPERYEPPDLATLFCVNDHKPPPEIRPALQPQTSLPEPTLSHLNHTNRSWIRNDL